MTTVALNNRASTKRGGFYTTMLASVAFLLAVVVLCVVLGEYGVSLPTDGEMPPLLGP